MVGGVAPRFPVSGGGMVCVCDAVGGGHCFRCRMSYVCRNIYQEPSSSREPIYGGVLWARIGKQPPTPYSIYNIYIYHHTIYPGIYRYIYMHVEIETRIHRTSKQKEKDTHTHTNHNVRGTFG